jgi:hypothetical protein
MMLRIVGGLTLTFTAPLALGWVLAKLFRLDKEGGR